MSLRAMIADDEPLLRQELARELKLQMPELEIVAEVGDGIAALALLKKIPVDIAFLDIRMPGLTGLEVARSLLDDNLASQDVARRSPLVIFVTAYDEYALKAFDAEAVDYLLKPVTSTRLQKTLERIRLRLAQQDNLTEKQALESKLERALDKLSDKSDNTLRSVRASIGDEIRIIPIEDIVLFRAEDKYVSVFTESRHALIREPLKELLPRLPSDRFARIHRSNIVNLGFVEAADRSLNGKMTLKVRGLDFQPSVSRSFRHLFKAM